MRPPRTYPEYSKMGNLKGYDLATWRLGDLATWRLGDLATWRLGDLATWRLGDLATWRLGDLATIHLFWYKTATPSTHFLLTFSNISEASCYTPIMSVSHTRQRSQGENFSALPDEFRLAPLHRRDKPSLCSQFSRSHCAPQYPLKRFSKGEWWAFGGWF